MLVLFMLLSALASCATSKPSQHLVARTYPTTLAAPSSGATLAVGSTDGSVWFVDTATSTISARTRVAGGAAQSISFSPDGTRAAVGTLSTDYLATWTIVTVGRSPTVLPIHTQDRVGLRARFRPDGSRLVLFTHDGGLLLVDCVAGGSVKVPPRHPHRITSASWWGDDRLITGESNGGICVRSSETGDALSSMPLLAEGIDCVAVSLDHKQVLTTFGEKARIWSLPDWKLDAEFKGQYYLYMEGDGMFEAAWSSEQILIALGTMYSIECRRRDGSLTWGHDYTLGHSVRLVCSFDPTGKYASCARDGGREGRIFDAATGERITTGVLESQRADSIVWMGDAASVAMLDRAVGAITVADTSTFQPRFALNMDEQGNLILAK